MREFEDTRLCNIAELEGKLASFRSKNEHLTARVKELEEALDSVEEILTVEIDGDVVFYSDNREEGFVRNSFFKSNHPELAAYLEGE